MMSKLHTKQLQFKSVLLGIVLDGEPPAAAAGTFVERPTNETASPAALVAIDEEVEGEDGAEVPPADVNCFAAILLGIKCEIAGVDGQTKKDNDVLDLVQEAHNSNNKNDEASADALLADGMITTVKEDLTPDADDSGRPTVVVFTADDAKPGFSSNYGGGYGTLEVETSMEPDTTTTATLSTTVTLSTTTTTTTTTTTSVLINSILPEQISLESPAIIQKPAMVRRVMGSDEKPQMSDNIMEREEGLAEQGSKVNVTSESATTQLLLTTDSEAEDVTTQLVPTTVFNSVLGEEEVVHMTDIEEDAETTTVDVSDDGITTVSSQLIGDESNTEPAEPRIGYPFNTGECGRLGGGAAVMQAFGRVAHELLPDLVASWVTGGSQALGGKRARLEVEGEPDKDDVEGRIIGGDVTSTIMYCWMAAIVEVLPSGTHRFVCTGTLVHPDLVVTSASCTNRLDLLGQQ